ncbi:DUF2156 domain-containing protein [Breznakiellaceae bacterium SP9]
MSIPCYPQFVPVALDLKDQMHALLSQTVDGVSEYTFANLYLFRKRYDYQVCLTKEGLLVLSGLREGKRFFISPCGAPDRVTLDALFANHDYWKGVPDSISIPNEAAFKERGITLTEDRDNFDYLYLRKELAELSGKKFHKKRNLVNQFENYYQHSERPFTKDLVVHAHSVLELWMKDKKDDVDYHASCDALEHFAELNLDGALYYVNDRPVGWCLGEVLARGTMFGIHFEKALDDFKGLYQFINMNFAASLPESYIYINREQDLGDEGLRQAKTTYRPCGFVRKCLGYKA